MNNNINESLFKDNTIFDELRNIVCTDYSPFNIYFPNSMEELTEDEKNECNKIDELYKSGKITREEALKLLASVFSGGMTRRRFEAFLTRIKIEELKRLLKKKWLELSELYTAYNDNLITKEEFFEQFRKINRKFYNDLKFFLEAIKVSEESLDNPELSTGGRTI